MLYACTCLFVLCIFNAQSQNFEVPINRKVIDEKGFKEIVYVTDKAPYPKIGRMYHWYKTRGVHFSQSNYAGELLDGEYLRYYPDNQLAEKGSFKNGLKVLVWNTWHQNGSLSTRSAWKSGRISGKYIQWDSLGNIRETGRYKKGMKTGKWIFPITGDTIRYKRGKRVIQDTTLANDTLNQRKSVFGSIFKKKARKVEDKAKVKEPKTRGFFGNLFGKKEEGGGKEEGKIKKRKKRPPNNKSDREGFFKRLFKKKEKKEGGKDA